MEAIECSIEHKRRQTKAIKNNRVRYKEQDKAIEGSRMHWSALEGKESKTRLSYLTV